jgi:PAS domain S-box-containing protein
MQAIIVENIIQSMPIGALAINPQGEIVIANDAAADILGFPLKTIMGKGWGELFLENQANRDFNQMLMDVIWQEPLNLHRKVSYTCPLGEVRHLSITSSFLKENKELTGIMVLLDDITEIHKLSLKEKSWLEERARLHQEKAEGLFRLSLAVAHQLRNPTAAIGGLAKLIQKKNTIPPVINDYSLQIIKCVERLENIVRAVEDYIAIPASKPCYIQSESFMAEIRSYAAHLADSPGHRIQWFFQVQPRNIFADPELLPRALMELLKNAVENIVGEGTVKVSLSGHNDHWAMMILDDGCGIAQENLPFIFDPFFTTKVLGIGMGLCSVQKIVSNHGGNILIDSKLGIGTTVKIYLPNN